MAELKLILTTYAQFYRRHIGLLLLFFIGFSLGAALLTAIQGLNLEAGKRYQQTTALIANPVTHFVRPVLGKNRLPNSMWSRIRAAGFTQVQPVLEGVIETDKQQKLALRGVNLLQWLTQNASSSSSSTNNSYSGFERLLNTVYIDPKLMQRLNLKNSSINIKVGDTTRTLAVSELQGLGMTMLVDISLADKLLRANGVISYFEVSGLNNKQAAQLNVLLGEQARLEAAQEQAFDALSEAFFFNLQALAFLGYVVGAFLSFNAIKLAYNARAHLQQQMWVLGCQRSALIKALVIELTLLSFIAAVLGAILGAALANALVMDVSATLRGLYQLDRSFVVNLDSSMIASGFVLNIVVLLGFLASQSARLSAFVARAKWPMLALVIIAASYLALTANTKMSALLLCVCVLLLFFVIAPPIVKAVFKLPWPTRNPIIQWLKADSIVQLPALLSSVLAILMAMGAAVGMQIMVGSFSDTLDTHLEKRLSADLYVRPEQNIQALQQSFMALPEVEKVGVYWSANSELKTPKNRIAADVMAFGSNAEYNQHLSLLNNNALTSAMFEKNKAGVIGCLVNEPALLQYQIKLGDVISPKQHINALTCQVRGA